MYGVCLCWEQVLTERNKEHQAIQSTYKNRLNKLRETLNTLTSRYALRGGPGRAAHMVLISRGTEADGRPSFALGARRSRLLYVEPNGVVCLVAGAVRCRLAIASLSCTRSLGHLRRRLLFTPGRVHGRAALWGRLGALRGTLMADSRRQVGERASRRVSIENHQSF